MEENIANEMLQDIAVKVLKKSIFIEVTGWFFALLGAAMKFADIQLAGVVLIISISGLSTFYFLHAFKPLEKSDIIVLLAFFKKNLYWGYAISLMGLLFAIMNWEFAYTLLVIGGLTIIMVIIASIYYYIVVPENKEVTIGLLLKSVAILAIVTLIFVTPREKIGEIFNSSGDANPMEQVAE